MTEEQQHTLALEVRDLTRAFGVRKALDVWTRVPVGLPLYFVPMAREETL